MIGNQLYKVEKDIELNNERLKSLILFYAPLINADSLYLYQYLYYDFNNAFTSINELLNRINYSINQFEKCLEKLNQYGLLKTLSNDEQYILILKEPLTIRQFMQDDILVRNFVLHNSGKNYQRIISDIYESPKYPEYKDISVKLPIDSLSNWSKEDETYIKERKKETNNYAFDTLFDVNKFLADISLNLFPARLRSKENLYKIARMADLYNISYDKMRSFIPKISNINSNNLDFNKLTYLCMNTASEYDKVASDEYDTPCLNYLMSLQDGKEATEFDKGIIFKLANEYHLSVPVINVLLAHALKNCDNRLISSYIYPIAADFYRNDIKTANDALDRLNQNNKKQKNDDVLPTYDASKNVSISKKDEEEILSILGKDE